jgi:hypothetical protein
LLVRNPLVAESGADATVGRTAALPKQSQADEGGGQTLRELSGPGSRMIELSPLRSCASRTVEW